MFPVFTATINILTLFSFVAHAIVGCCAHHTHAADHGNKDTHQHSSPLAEKSGTVGTAQRCCHRHVPARSDSNEHPAEITTNVNVAAQQNSESSAPEIPGHPSDCDEGHCSFLVSKDVSASLKTALAFDVAGGRYDCHAVRISVCRSIGIDRDLPHCCHSAMSHCARLHCWLV